MKKTNRWALAAIAAALTLFGTARAQGAASGSPSGSSDRTTTSPGTSTAPGSSDQSATGGSTGGSTRTAPSDTGPAGDTGASSSGSMGSASASGSATAATGKIDKKLQDELERIHAANQAELHMAQLGLQNGQSPEVKQFSEKLQTDHQRFDQKLTQVAQAAGASSLEGKTYQKEMDRGMKDMNKLQSKSGTDFDKEFMSHMVKDHQKDVKEVDQAAKDARKQNQTELAALLEQGRTGMQGHLDMAKDLQGSIGQGGQRQGRRPGATGSSGATDTGSTGTGAAGGSRGDTGGPPPTGSSSGPGGPPGPAGGAPGTSSESGKPEK